MITLLEPSVWQDQAVHERLSWYHDVLRDRKPAKFLICKAIATAQNPKLMTEEQLWKEHGRLQPQFLYLLRTAKEGETALGMPEKERFTFLDLKVELLNRMLRKCAFCEWRCKVDRVEGTKKGACHLDSAARVSTFFRHFGEEPPLVDRHGSGTIFFSSCTFRCAFCLHPTSQILTQSGPAQIAEIFAKASGRTTKNESSIAWPSNLLTIDHVGRAARVRKVFRHVYSGKMRIIKPYFLPALIASPDHEIYATPKPGVVPVRKYLASELRKGWFLAVPKLKAFESNDELGVAEVLGNNAPPYRKSTKITRMKAKTIIRLRSRGATSTQIAESVGLTASYVRKIAPKLERDGITDHLFWGEDSLLDDDGYVHYKLEKRPYIPSRIKMDERLAQLLGFYCAEGFVVKMARRPNSYRLIFSFGKHEPQLAKTTKKLLNNIFGIRPQLVERESTITVESGKSTLALLFAALCGSKSYEKRVPSGMFRAKRDIVQAFLRAYVQGDGCTTQNMISTDTVSLRLAMGICWLFLRNNVIPRFYEYKPPRRKKVGPRTVRQSLLYYVKVPLIAYRRNVLDQKVSEIRGRYELYQEDGTYFYVLLRRVTDSHYAGPVFNLETAEDSHSYLANFLSVGNCQNWDISQDPDAGAPVSPRELSLIIKSLRSEGAANINFVGGEPTPNLHVILEALNLTSVNVPILWNSNMYLTPEAMQILADVADIWLPDFKWGNDRCAVNYSRIVRYFEVVSRNHAAASANGDMIIRHLVMPGHLECCTEPILEWIAEHCPRALVNIMDQYRPEHLVLREPEKYRDIARWPSFQEISAARSHADKLGLVWAPVS